MWWNVVVWAKSWGGKSRHHQTLPQLKHSSRGWEKERKKNKKKRRGKIHEEEKLSNTNSFRIFSWLFHTQHTKSLALTLSRCHFPLISYSQEKSNLYNTFSFLSSHNRDRAAKLLKWWGYGKRWRRVCERVRAGKWRGKAERENIYHGKLRKACVWKLLCEEKSCGGWGIEENEKFNHFRLIHVYIAHSTTFSRLRELCFALSAWDFHSRFEQLVFGGEEGGKLLLREKIFDFLFFFLKHSSAQARYSLSCIKIELRGLAIRIIIVFFSAQISEWLMITCRQLLSIVSGLFRLLDFYKIHFLECWREEGENWEWEISRFRDVSRAEYTAWLEKVRRWRRE